MDTFLSSEFIIKFDHIDAIEINQSEFNKEMSIDIYTKSGNKIWANDKDNIDVFLNKYTEWLMHKKLIKE